MVHLFHQLKSMVYLIMASAGSFFWTVFLVSIMMYCMAVYFTDLATGIAQRSQAEGGLDYGAPSVTPPCDSILSSSDKIQQHWGTIGDSILSAYMAISGGDDWRNLVDVFGRDPSYLFNTLIFSFYIAFATLVMLNLVTGVFVEGA